jgi:chromosome segregation ATPase
MRAAWSTCLLLLPALVAAQGQPVDGIYSCIDERGRRITSDRPIPECVSREQRVLNRDGSVKATRPPTPTAEERAEQEARERAAAQLRQEQAELVRRDRNLMQRYRNEEAHRKAREDSLESVRMAIKASEVRLHALAAERKPLLDEAEFYVGKALPPKLKAQIDANDASLDAQKSSMANQQAELVRVNRLYDIELDRLRRLWAGARPGSMGPLAGPSAVAPAKPGPAPAASR